MQFIKSQFCRRIAMALGLVIAAAVPSQSALIIDLQATGAVGATLINSKSIQNATVGAVITFNVVALITGADGNPNNEGLLSLAGGIKSDAGPIKMNMSTFLANSFWNTPSAPGTVQDLDADGDSDLGSNNNASSAGFFTVRSSATDPIAGTPLFRLGPTFVLGTVSATVTVAPNGSSQLNFFKRNNNVGGTWQQDGIQLLNQGTLTTYGPGTPVTIEGAVIPEPSTLALGGIALVGFAGMQLRRRKVK